MTNKITGLIFDYMNQVNVTILKAKLSEKLAEVKDGASFIVTDRRTPIARLIPMESEEDILVERAAAGSFKPIQSQRPGSLRLEWRELLAAERGDR